MINKKLEDLREDDIGTICACLKLNNKFYSFVMTYPYYSTVAFYYSCQQIEKLENSKTVLNQGNEIQSTLGMWFISIESYINSILRITSFLRNENFNDIIRTKLTRRIKTLYDHIDLDRLEFYRSTFQKLEDFLLWRNEIFHDRIYNKPLTFSKTLFSKNPFFSNQIDVMQAFIISLEIFETFRFIVPSIDLMPNINIDKNGTIYSERLDVLYNKVIYPWFLKILEKHSLSTSLELQIKAKSLPESNLFIDKKVEMLIKVKQDDVFIVNLSKENTFYGKDLMEILKSTTQIEPGKFRLPNYKRA